MYKVSKEFMFSMAHMLEGYDGQCLNLHGHDYKLIVTVSTKNCTSDMVIDFCELKRIVKEVVIDKLDHAFGYKVASSDKVESEIVKILTQNGRKTYAFSFRPTAENMCKHIFDILKPKLNTEAHRISSVELYETPTSYCVYSED